MTLQIEKFTLGPFATNAYVLHVSAAAGQDSGNECWVIDCPYQPGAMLRAITERGWRVTRVLLTHAHCDHIAGLDELRARHKGVRVTVPALERAWLEDALLNLSALGGIPVTVGAADDEFRKDERLVLGEGMQAVTLAVRETPGHSPGGITLWCETESVAFVGDALFAGSIGRTDFPGSSFAQLERSIRTEIYTLPERTVCMPGHGPSTTVGQERCSNPFVRGD